MPTIHVTDVYGKSHTIEANYGLKLMEILREFDFGVAASCGGFCSCATCHVYVDPSWIDRLPDRHSDEADLLSMLTTYDSSTSRLSCQVEFTPALDGIVLTVAPEE
ncbi:MAG TPA: 2Fe-2S iron-sulfur cluster-binding protein [Steroidobacteraceae bacterium]|nr:2Fe-2S iron-sulfur cluster-binding protein [Steroidobacteraceae bacterium]